MLVSFVGSLPLGTLNIAAMQISINNGYRPAIEFAIGMLLAEVVYVRISLVAMDAIRKQEKLLKALEWITLFVVLALALASFVAAAKTETKAENIILSNGLPRFLLGLIMSALNPVQIPFWFGWSTILFTKKILLPRNDHYNVYIAGIGIGTLLGTCVFIFGGHFIVDKLNANQHSLNYIIGSVFLFTAFIQVFKMVRKKDAVQKIRDIPEEKLHPEREL